MKVENLEHSDFFGPQDTSVPLDSVGESKRDLLCPLIYSSIVSPCL